MAKKKRKNTQNHSERSDYRHHHELIIAQYLAMFEETGKIPTQVKLAKACGFSRDTISKHLANETLAEIIPAFKKDTLAVLSGLTKRAKHGKSMDVELWLAVIHDFIKKSKISGFIGTVDPTKLTTEQLQRIAQGEDIANVVANPKP